MKVQINTDHHIQGDESLVRHVERTVDHSLSRFRHQVIRVNVHVSDANAGKNHGSDKQCTMEVRLEGRPPAVASQNADNLRNAVNGAARKLQRVLDSSLGRLSH